MIKFLDNISYLHLLFILDLCLIWHSFFLILKNFLKQLHTEIRKPLKMPEMHRKWEHPNFTKSPQAVSLGLILRSPSSGAKNPRSP